MKNDKSVLTRKNYINIITSESFETGTLDRRVEMFDYKDLKLEIIRVFDNQNNFAIAMGMSKTALSQRLNNKIYWTTPEMVKACELLGIPLERLHEFFLKLKSFETGTK